MLFSVSCSVGSLALGLGAWIAAVLAIANKTSPKAGLLSTGSFALCVFSLLFQLLEVKYRAGISDFSAIEDTIGATVFAACVLIGVTVVLNVIAAVKAGRTTRSAV